MKYSREHVWAREEDGLVRLGLSEYAQEELGELTFIEFPEKDSHIEGSSILCSIDSLKAASDVYAPFSGKVVEINESLARPGGASTVNQDPVGEGWLVVFQPDSPDAINELLSEEEYLRYIRG